MKYHEIKMYFINLTTSHEVAFRANKSFCTVLSIPMYFSMFEKRPTEHSLTEYEYICRNHTPVSSNKIFESWSCYSLLTFSLDSMGINGLYSLQERT